VPWVSEIVVPQTTGSILRIAEAGSARLGDAEGGCVGALRSGPVSLTTHTRWVGSQGHVSRFSGL